MRIRSIFTTMACMVLTSAAWATPEQNPKQEEEAHHTHPDESEPPRVQMHEEHGHAGSASSSLVLNGTEKWPTDAALRSGMAAIHAAFEADHPAIHAGKQTDAQYDTLAGRIEKQVQYIIANCKLPAAADANLHLVVADLMQGISLMRGADPARSRHDGAALVHGALQAYPRFFDDPTWTPAQALP
jgi:hypothetical protein